MLARYALCLLESICVHALYASALFHHFPRNGSFAPISLPGNQAPAPKFTAPLRVQPRAAAPSPINGPVISSNFPDPSAILVSGTWYAFGTDNHLQDGPSGQNIQIATSTDFVNWTLTGRDALPTIGEWAHGEAIWAPNVIQRQDGTFVMYYAANALGHPFKHCIGAATSATVEGPYAPIATSITCPLKQGGAIDPSGFLDIDGKHYVVYKVDGNSMDKGRICVNNYKPSKNFVPRPTPLMLQALASDASTPIGPPIELLNRDAQDGPLIEAPSLVRSRDGTYILFYSSNCFTTTLYNVAYATSDALTGPYIRAAAPLIKTGMGPSLKGPGGATVTPDGSKLVFHGIIGRPTQKRAHLTRGMYTAEIQIEGANVVLA